MVCCFTDPYAVPMNCQPIENLPPPPGFDLSTSMSDADVTLTFNIADLPPPIPETLPPATSSVRSSEHSAIPIKHSTPHTHTTSNNSSGIPKTNSKGAVPPPTLAKKGNKLNTNFMAQLDSKLGGPTQSMPASQPQAQKSNPALQNLMNNKSRDSPPRGNLLSQIHSGVQLRRTENVNDRSAPIL